MTEINKKDKSEVESPCIRNCCLDESDVCLGCFRHVDEIVEWGSANKKRRECILESTKTRRIELADKRNKN